MEDQLKVIGYMRVSTNQQDHAMQEKEIDAFVSRKAGWELAKIYKDTISGSKAKRPGLDALLQDGFEGKFKVIIVYDISRLARSTLDALQLLKTFTELKIRFISIKNGFDTEGDSMMSKAMFTLFSLFAEIERSNLIFRVKSGIANARSRGVKFGRPSIEINLEKLKTLRDQKLSVRKIAEMLNVKKGIVEKGLKILKNAA